MRRLNAFDAVSPALTRTHQLLFRPFRLGRSWKLAASQYLGLIGAFFVPFPLAGLFFLSRLPGRQAASAGLALTAVLLGITLGLFAFFYIGQRLQFVDFDMMVTREQFVAPMWRRNGGRLGPFLLTKTVGSTFLALLMVPLFAHVGRGLFTRFADFPQGAAAAGATPDPALLLQLLAHMLTLYGMIFVAFLILKLFSTLLEDFVMPFYLVETLSFGASVVRGFGLLREDPLGCAGFLCVKFGMGVLGFLAQYASNMVLLIPLCLVGFLAVALGFALQAALHLGTAGHIALALVGVVIYLLFMGLLLWFQLGTLGYLFTFLQAYGMYFVGSRYPALGDLLEPPPPPTYLYAPPPSMPGPEEDADDDGPGFPMDPALA